MPGRDFFQLFCMFHLQLINRKCDQCLIALLQFPSHYNLNPGGQTKHWKTEVKTFDLRPGRLWPGSRRRGTGANCKHLCPLSESEAQEGGVSLQIVSSLWAWGLKVAFIPKNYIPRVLIFKVSVKVYQMLESGDRKKRTTREQQIPTPDICAMKMLSNKITSSLGSMNFSCGPTDKRTEVLHEALENQKIQNS